MKQDSRSVRWVVYGVYGLIMLLLLAQARLPISTSWHQVIELGIVGVMVSLITWWQRRHATVLEDDAILHTLEQGARRQHPLTPVQARYLVAQERHALRRRAAAVPRIQFYDADNT